MDRWIFSFITASVLSLTWTSLPPSPVIAIIVIMALFCINIPKLKTASGFLFGCIWMASVGHWQATWQMPSEKITDITSVRGQVNSIVRRNDDLRLTMQVHSVNHRPMRQPISIRLSWKAPQWQVRQGQIVELKVKLKPAHGLANEGGFNYQVWLFSQNIVATGYVKHDLSNQLLEDKSTVRQSLIVQLARYELQNEAWVAALALGDRSLFTPADWQLIQTTGIAHLVAISGLHLAIVASSCYLIFTTLVRFSLLFIRLNQRINLRLWAMLFALTFTLFYAWIAGFSMPTVRAWTAILIYSMLIWRNKNWRPKHLILYSVFAFVVLFPLSLFSLSFWLSFCAVIIISLVFWRWPMSSHQFSFKNTFRVMLTVQLALSTLMLPLIAWQFGFISVISPLVNIIAVPLVTLLLVPLSLFCILLMLLNSDSVIIFLRFLDSVLEHCLKFLYWLDAGHFSAIEIPVMPLQVWLCIWLSMGCLVLPRLPHKKKFCLILTLPLISYMAIPHSDSWKVTVLDVGQGLAVVISKNRRALLYDIGGAYPSGFNMADSVILPWLKAKGIKQLDWLLISHYDNDHAGALSQLKEGIQINGIISPRDYCVLGWHNQWQGLTVKALWPQKQKQVVKNNDSCVVHISDGKYSVLLPGDIERVSEALLIERNAEQLKATLLVVPHHGSNTSSSQDFLAAVSPQHSIFSEGYMNRWGFPKQQVVDRYLQTDSQLYSTSEDGQITVCFGCGSGGSVVVQTYRSEFFPFWYGN
jgi:competence protein ComEC